MYIPFDERLGVHPQHEGFTDYARWDFKHTPEDHYPLLLHYPYFQLYRKQVVKQADLVLAMYMRSEAFTAEEKARNFAYYEPLTVRDSSLSACTQSVVAAEVGQLDLAHDYLAEAALMDLRDVEHNTSDGVHMASLAGAWMALVAGFGGMRAGTGTLSFSPHLPSGLSELRFRLRYRGRKLKVTIGAERAKYELIDGEPLAQDVGRVLDLAAAVAGQVAGEQGLELDDERELVPAGQLLAGQVGADLDALTQGDTHRLSDLHRKGKVDVFGANRPLFDPDGAEAGQGLDDALDQLRGRRGARGR